MDNLTNKIFSKTPYLTLLYKWVSCVPTPSCHPAKTGRNERSGHCPTAFLKPKRVVANIPTFSPPHMRPGSTKGHSILPLPS